MQSLRVGMAPCSRTLSPALNSFRNIRSTICTLPTAHEMCKHYQNTSKMCTEVLRSLGVQRSTGESACLSESSMLSRSFDRRQQMQCMNDEGMHQSTRPLLYMALEP